MTTDTQKTAEAVARIMDGTKAMPASMAIIFGDHNDIIRDLLDLIQEMGEALNKVKEDIHCSDEEYEEFLAIRAAFKRALPLMKLKGEGQNE